jgi:hypothetical protein
VEGKVMPYSYDKVLQDIREHEGERQAGKGDQNNKYYALDHYINEDVMMEYGDPVIIEAEVRKVLNRSFGPTDVFVVRRLAQAYADAIAYELRMQDGDMVEVLQLQWAVLRPLNEWLQSTSTDVRKGRSSACERF